MNRAWTEEIVEQRGKTDAFTSLLTRFGSPTVMTHISKINGYRASPISRASHIST